MCERRTGLPLRAARGAIEIVLAMLVGFVSIGSTASAAGVGSRPFLVRNVRIFDGEKVIAANSVAVANGKIAAVGTNLARPPDAEVIDGSGDTLLPGLIDSHVHIWVRQVLEMGLIMGVTTELDMYMRWEDAQRWKKEEAEGATDIADFRTAGTCFTVAGGHGTEWTLPPITPIQRAEQAQALVDERIAHGSDYIKIMYDNGPRFAAMPKDIMAAIVKAAHRRGKLVIVHAFSPQGILDVIDAGADGLAHVPIVKLPEPQFRDALKAHRVFAITTLGFTDFFFGAQRLASRLPEDPSIAPYLGPLWPRALHAPAWNSPEHISYADNEAALRTLHDAGVPLLAGTDASNTMPAGALLHTELELVVKAGLSATEALADATSVPARVFGLADRGRIAPGLRADLLLVRGDPTRNIRATRDIVDIWKRGVRIDRANFRANVAQQDAAWRLGAGWRPLASSGSNVQIAATSGGPNHARVTVALTGEVKPDGGDFLYAGAEYLPALGYRMANGDLSGVPQISFWTRGDGKTYTITLFPADGTPTTKYFTAGKDWSRIVFPFSAFGTDGRNIASVRIASSIPGPFRFELADAHMGAHRWLGVELNNDPKSARIDGIDKDSPAERAGLRAGDTITAFNGKPVRTYRDVLMLLSETRVKDRVPIEIEREGKRRTVVIEVAERPQ
jgi:imidazolonepropionase-like amidohydrolase